MLVRKVIIPAAGLGSRFLPLTKVVPKELLPLGHKPAIHYVVEEAKLSGIEQFYLVTNRHKPALFDYFRLDDELLPNLKGGHAHPSLAALRDLVGGLSFHEIEQSQPQGLGHAIALAADVVGDDAFAVMLPDDILIHSRPNLKLMIDIAVRTGKAVVGLQQVDKKLVSFYGIASIKGSNQSSSSYYEINKLVEKPSQSEAPSNLAVVGRYVLPASIMKILQSTKPGKNGEVQLTDALSVLAEQGGLLGFELEGHRLDVGTPQGLSEANLFLSVRRNLNSLEWLDTVIQAAKREWPAN